MPPTLSEMIEQMAQEGTPLVVLSTEPLEGGRAEQPPEEDRRRCVRCGHRYLPSAMFYHSAVSGEVCSDCYDELDDQEEEEPSLYDYDFKPTPIFLPKWTKDDLFLGVELETDGDYNYTVFDAIKELRELASAHAKSFYLKQDGSLDRGFEVVTHPATLQYHQGHFPWGQIADIVTNHGGKSHNTNTCGLHIHFNVDFYGNNTKEQNINTLKLLYLVERYWGRIATFSRRDPYNLNQWARRYRKQFSNWTPEELQIEKCNAPRNAAVNITNEDTLEVRVFRGTLHIPTILATIEFVDYLARIAKEATIQKLQKATWTRFVKKIDPKIYPHLTPYLMQRRLIDVPDNYEAEASPTTEC